MGFEITIWSVRSASFILHQDCLFRCNQRDWSILLRLYMDYKWEPKQKYQNLNLKIKSCPLPMILKISVYGH